MGRNSDGPIMAHTHLRCQLGWLRLGRAPARLRSQLDECARCRCRSVTWCLPVLRDDVASCGSPPGRLTWPTATAQAAAAAPFSLNGGQFFLVLEVSKTPCPLPVHTARATSLQWGTGSLPCSAWPVLRFKCGRLCACRESTCQAQKVMSYSEWI